MDDLIIASDIDVAFPKTKQLSSEPLVFAPTNRPEQGKGVVAFVTPRRFSGTPGLLQKSQSSGIQARSLHLKNSFLKSRPPKYRHRFFVGSIAIKPMDDPLALLRRFASAPQTPWTLDDAMAALGPFADRIVPVLHEALRSDDRDLQLLALQFVRELGAAAEKLIPVLIDLLQHQSRLLRCGSITALSAVGPAAKDAVPIMMAGLALEDDVVRALSVRSILQIQPASRSELKPVIEELLRSDDECVRLEIEAAVQSE